MSVEHLTQLNQSDFFLKMFVLSDLRIESIWHFSLITKMTWRESSSVPIPCSLKVSSSLRGLSLPNLYIVSINCFYCCYSLFSATIDRTHIRWLSNLKNQKVVKGGLSTLNSKVKWFKEKANEESIFNFYLKGSTSWLYINIYFLNIEWIASSDTNELHSLIKYFYTRNIVHISRNLRYLFMPFSYSIYVFYKISFWSN